MDKDCIFNNLITLLKTTLLTRVFIWELWYLLLAVVINYIYSHFVAYHHWAFPCNLAYGIRIRYEGIADKFPVQIKRVMDPLCLPHHWLRYGPLTRYAKLSVAHAPGMLGKFSSPPRVSDPYMHHGTCVTHVPWCLLGSLTSGFFWSRWRRKRSRHTRRMRNPQFCESGKRPMQGIIR